MKPKHLLYLLLALLSVYIIIHTIKEIKVINHRNKEIKKDNSFIQIVNNGKGEDKKTGLAISLLLTQFLVGYFDSKPDLCLLFIKNKNQIEAISKAYF